MKILLSFVYFLFFFAVQINAQDTLQITDFGVIPDSRNDVVPALKKCLDSCRNLDKITINFPKGRYDFWPSNCENEPSVTIGFHMTNLNNVTIEGNGSEFVFHGIMQVARIDSCENTIFRNFSVDWDRPITSQAEIVDASDNYLDIRIDKTQYPFLIENDIFMFTGEGWKLPIERFFLLDKDKKEIIPRIFGELNYDIFQQTAKEMGNDIVRFMGNPGMKPIPGTYLSLSTNVKMRKGPIIPIRFQLPLDHPPHGFMVTKSKNTLLKNIMIYHALWNGVYGEISENITIDNVNVTANESKGRLFSSYADAFHFSNCKGVIKVENCEHTYQGDDFINVHGRNVVIEDIFDSKTIVVKPDGRFMLPGDEVWFLKEAVGQRGEIRVVDSLEAIFENDKHTGYRISFATDLPKSITNGDFIENKTWTASLELRNCRILKKNIARGILVTTPKTVLIENNYFRSAGAAILIEGDNNFWFESGATTNVIIRNNIFDDCLTSGNATGNRWEWGEAIICISPSHRPLNANTEPYHQNIIIQDNIFKVFDVPLVRARSVKGLQFIGNEIIKTETYKPYTWQKCSFLLDGCRSVLISGNQIDERYTTRTILIEHMKKTDVKSDKDHKFKIDFVDKSVNTYFH